MDYAITPLQISTTLESEADARRIASALVEQRLAACVQIDGPIRSVYRWKGAIEEAVEYRLTIKTATALRDDVAGALVELHPYELPEIVFVPLEASAEYTNWIDENTGTSE